MVAVLCLALSRTIRQPPLVPWTAAWLALLGALCALWLSLLWPACDVVGYPAYMFFEYVFGYLVYAGCREHVMGTPITWRHWPTVALLAVPALLLAWLAQFQLNVFLALHGPVYGGFFLLSWAQLRRVEVRRRSWLGVQVLRVALALLALLNIAYGPVFALSAFGVIAHEPPFLAYSSFYDLLLLTMLAFGMIMVTTGEVQSDLESALDRLAGSAQTDHLTAAFNRHAFQTVLSRELAGTAVIADIDNLKSINDQFGHAAGDAAIRAVATAIRSLIRADDLLFRWGGDEFLVLLSRIAEGDARVRLADVNERLRAVAVPGREEAVSVSVAMGFAPFDSSASLDAVIRVADEAMYGRKRGGA